MNSAAPTRTAAVLTLASLALLMCATAHAQPVRKCQLNGRIVFQSSPCPTEAHVASAAPQAAAADTSTLPKAPPRKKTLADLLRERDDPEQPSAPPREFQGDGASVLRSRMGAV